MYKKRLQGAEVDCSAELLELYDRCWKDKPGRSADKQAGKSQKPLAKALKPPPSSKKLKTTPKERGKEPSEEKVSLRPAIYFGAAGLALACRLGWGVQ